MTKKSTPQSSLQLICIIILIAVILAPAAGLCGKGRKEISLDGGKIGSVPFDHHLHQDVVGDCMVCHQDFAQKAGALNDAKAAKQLKKKQVMNSTCIKCHKAKKKAGEKHGPTSCKACHKK